MNADVLIKNGHVIDPSTGTDKIVDIAFAGEKMIDISQCKVTPSYIIDAKDCIVTPGFIDFHSHVFYGDNNSSCNPDSFIPMGVTAAVDAGSAGWANFNSFYKSIVLSSRLRIKSYIAYSNYGIMNHPESYEIQDVNHERIAYFVNKYPGTILGLKLLMVQPSVNDIEPLKRVIKLAEELSVGVCVHVQASVVSMDDIAGILRPGDIFCHAFHGKNETILNKSGNVSSEVRKAKERGVVFDMCNGNNNFSFCVAQKAMEQGIYPDVISSDNTIDKINISQCVRSLPYVMSKMLAMGMDLFHVIKAVTETPANLMNMHGKIGSLAVGAYADIAITKVKNVRAIHIDSENSKMEVPRHFVPQMTICSGKIAYSCEEFNLRTEG